MADDAPKLPISAERILSAHLQQLATRVLVDKDESAVAPLVELLRTTQDAQAIEDHRRRLDTLIAEGKTLELARYLGECGENETGLETFLGRLPTEDEVEAFQVGTRRRQLEVRAIQLSRLRKAGGDVAKWMEK